MKTVRLAKNTVTEIVPDYALPVEQWFSAEFSAQCMEAPDTVEQRWTYDPKTGVFSPPVDVPVVPTPTPQEDADAVLVDHEYRLTLLELGVTNDAV